MKKQYINPAIEIVKVEVQQIMTASLNPENNRGTVSNDFVTSGTAGESREGKGFWDE